MRKFALLLVLTTPIAGQEFGAHDSLLPKYNEPQDVARGELLFRQACAVCHGAEAKGGAQGPPLNTGRFKHAVADNDLYTVIANGIPGTQMPASAYEAPDVWRLISYMQSLAASRGTVELSGNPEAGMAVLRDKGRCLNCHTLGPDGNSGGPDLTEIGTLLSAGQIESALVEPNGEVRSNYWRAKARTKAGEEVVGYRLNEDTFSVQIRSRGRLRSLDKRQLTSYEVLTESPMPSYGDKLTETELADIVAYLTTLGGRR